MKHNAQVLSVEKATNLGGLLFPLIHVGLFKLGRDAREVRIERGAYGIDGGNDHNRNASGDQTVFNGRSTRLVLQKCDYSGHY